MATLKDEAIAYEQKQTKNIADLEVVSTLIELKKATAKDKDGKEFAYRFISLNGEDYRVPDVVIRDLKTLLEEKPKLIHFKVKKSGTGLGTRYSVIPIG